MVASRDIRCGNDVAKMAALGRYAQEFIIFAVSYLEDGKLWHRVSSDQEEIWRFVETCRYNDNYPAVVEEWVNRTLVPSGESDAYLLRSKISMAQKMKKQYTERFFAEFEQFLKIENNNEAGLLLWQWQDELIGCFEKEPLERFHTLVQYAYQAKKVRRNEYERLLGWIMHIFKQMEDDVVIKKSFERTFYGIGYKVHNEKKYFVNAKKPLVWQKRQQLMSEGTMATPIWQKTYRYDYQPDLLKTRDEFLAYIPTWFDDEYWQRLETIHLLPGAISPQAYEAWLDTLDGAYSGQIATAKYYKTCWGI